MRGTDAADGGIVFPAADGPWIMPAVFAGLAAAMTTVGLVLVVVKGPTAGVLIWLAQAGGFTLLLGWVAWSAARAVREVALDPEGLTIRRPDGAMQAYMPWAEVEAIETEWIGAGKARRLAASITRRDGGKVLIDPWQTADTATLAREAQRRREDAARRGG